MPKIRILSSLSQEGFSARANEDAFGWNDCSTFVIDGATGLGENSVIEDAGSDAAWLAKHASVSLKENLVRDSDVQCVVRNCIETAKQTFEVASAGLAVERYAWPSASFVLAHIGQSGISFAGLGDCTIIWRSGSSTGTFSPLVALSSFESHWAAKHLKRAGGFKEKKDLLTDPQTLADLRAMRALQNTPESGVWTLGLEPEAADHLAETRPDQNLPLHCLLCTDGFYALVDSYDAYTPNTLITAAIGKGLEHLFDELRQIENEVDPDGEKFPRFKRSDDATALLLEIL